MNTTDNEPELELVPMLRRSGIEEAKDRLEEVNKLYQILNDKLDIILARIRDKKTK